MGKYDGEKGPFEDKRPKPKLRPNLGQFKPGESGNPAGRPKMNRPAAVVLDDLLNSKVVVNVDGRRRRRSLFEVFFMSAVKDAMAGNAAARRDVMRMARDYGYSPPRIGFGTMMQNWLAMEGELPEASTRWLVNTDRLCEALRKAGAIRVDDEGQVSITSAMLDRLMGPDLSEARRKALHKDLRSFGITE